MDDDDWMNPQLSYSWTIRDQRKAHQEAPFIIQRCCRVPVSGNVSHVDEWRYWSSHTTRDERDAELRTLKARGWTVRPASYDGLDRLSLDIDDDAVLAQAALILARRKGLTK